MNPSLHLRLNSVVRALKETVRPAVGDDARAIEQLDLSIAHLEVIVGQLDSADGLERFELEGYTRLAADLLSVCVGGPAVMQSSRALRAALTETDGREAVVLRDRTNRLAGAIEALIRVIDVDGTEAFREAAMTLLLKSERRRIEANRSLFGGMGWEDVSELRDMSALRTESTQSV